MNDLPYREHGSKIQAAVPGTAIGLQHGIKNGLSQIPKWVLTAFIEEHFSKGKAHLARIKKPVIYQRITNLDAPALSVSRRIRKTPFTQQVTDQGVKAYTVYNHMLLPTVFDTMEADYHHLKKHVQIWDVSCERQVEIMGPDAQRLIQMLTPRDLSNLDNTRCFYTPMVDETGGMLNDPLTLKIEEDRYWVSIADSDLLLWAKGLAYGMHLDVHVHEPDIFPLAIQGPKSDELMARVFGESTRDIGFFRYKSLPFDGVPLTVARSGYSKQGGFEIYVDGWEIGPRLWAALMEKGEDLEVRAGCPNAIERIESGLLSYGNDMTRQNTPHECGLGKFCDTLSAIGCVGRDALLRVASEGPMRQIRSLEIEGPPLTPCVDTWPMFADGDLAGQITSAVWSPDFETNVAIGMVEMAHWDEGSRVEVETSDGMRKAIVHENFFN